MPPKPKGLHVFNVLLFEPEIPPIMPVPTITATVAGSSGSRREAVSPSSRWWRISRDITAPSSGSTPIRVSHGTTRSAPSVEWSPSSPFPMSWKIAASSSRSGLDTLRTNEEAFTAACIRCRSTVN